MTAGEATREYYREQGRKQERERIIKLWNDWCDWAVARSKSEVQESLNSEEFTFEKSRAYFLSLIEGEK